MLCASVDDEEVGEDDSPEFPHSAAADKVQTESSLSEIKSQVKMILRRLTRNSEPQASIESGNYNVQ